MHRCRNHHGHHLAAKIEGNLVHLGILRNGEVAMNLLMLQDGAVENVFQSGLKVTIEEGEFQYTETWLPNDITVLFKKDAVHRQRAGFVGTEDVHRAEVLDRVQPLDDHLLARHQQGALGEAHTYDHREHFRCKPNRNREGEQERFAPIMLAEAIDEKNQRHHNRHEPKHEPSKPGYALIEASWCWSFQEGVGHGS